MFIVGVHGPKYSGKDTVSDMIVEGPGSFTKDSFATPIKAMLAVGLGLKHDQLYGDQKEVVDPRYGKTPRDIMQTLGTQWGRQMVCDDIWAQALFVDLLDYGGAHPGQNVVIADVRFENEASLIRGHGGLIIHIEGREVGGEGTDHESEVKLKWCPEDIVMDNSGTLDDLRRKFKPISARIQEKLPL